MMAGFDETVVREAAIISISKICSMISDSEITGQIIPMLFRLANNEANFTCRVSAVNLMCPLYPRAGTQKEKIR
jgi:serine/threonine-protein phosphatase 2A regulatory subunit A